MNARSYRSLLRARPEGGLTEGDVEILVRLMTRHRPLHCLEIGMAHGVSSLVILEHLPSGGQLTSIDPYQSTDWDGAGLANVRAAGFAGQHRLIETADFLALPELVRAGELFDLVLIDGWHSFDYVMLDLFYSDLLLRSGGFLGFDDCNMPAIRRALRFLTTHRPYEELHLTRPRYTASNALKTFARFALRWPVNDRWFMKLGSQRTPWNFYHHF